MIKRASCINVSYIKEISGRSNYAIRPLDDIIASKVKPAIKVIKPEYHSYDCEAKAFGISGYEYRLLQKRQEEIIKRPSANLVLFQAYKEFLLKIKIYDRDILETVRKNDDRKALEAAKRDQKYVQQMKSWNKRIENIEVSWNSSREAITNRWNQILDSLSQLIEKNPLLDTMDDNDQYLIQTLSDKGWIVIKNNSVRWTDWEYLRNKIDYTEINEVILDVKQTVVD